MSTKNKKHLTWKTISKNWFHPKIPNYLLQRTYYPCFPFNESPSTPITILSDSIHMNQTTKNKMYKCPLIETRKTFFNSNDSLTPIDHQFYCKKKGYTFRDYRFDLHTKIFRDKDKIFKKQFGIIDNKLNIRYAENEEQYQKQLNIMNLKRIQKGQAPHCDGTQHLSMLNKHLGKMKEKVSFLKCVTNFAYINIETMKIKMTKNEPRLSNSKSVPLYNTINLKAQVESKDNNDNSKNNNSSFSIKNYYI